MLPQKKKKKKKKKKHPQQPIAVVHGGSKVCKTCTSKVYKASQTSQLIVSCAIVAFFLSCKTLLANANACIFWLLLVAVAGCCCLLWLVVVSCCGWLLLVAVASLCCFIFVIRQNNIFNGVKMCTFTSLTYYNCYNNYRQHSDLPDPLSYISESQTNIGEIYF